MNIASKKYFFHKSYFGIKMSREGLFSAKAVALTSAILLGSGAAVIIYQYYEWSRRQKCLSTQILQLKQQIIKLEAEIRQIREAAGASSSTEEIDDIFVDASDVAQDISSPADVHKSNSATDISRPSGHLARVLPILDQQLDRGGSENLTNIYHVLCELSKNHSSNVEVLWRLAKAAFLVANEEVNQNSDNPREGHRDLIQKAHDAALAAVRLDDQNGDAHKWLAIVIGSITQYLPIQEQIKNAYTIKEHIQAAIQFKPQDALLYYMLGRWCYSVYMLSWMERKVASTLFAEPPTATLEEAMECFNKAEELNPCGSIGNALYLGKAFIAQQDYKMAVHWLRVGSNLACSSSEDIKSQNEIASLLAQYEAYASD